MMTRKVAVVLMCVCAAAALSLSCRPAQKKVKDPIVQVGKVTIGQESFDVFRNRFLRSYPAAYPHYFPGHRQPATFMAEAEAIWQFVKSDSLRRKIQESHDWKWKEKYFRSGLFIELLNDNLGFTDAELMKRYEQEKEEFRSVVQTAEGNDSSVVHPFENVRRQVADRVFFDKYPPDSAFLASIESHDHDHDEAAVRNYWIYHARTNPLDFFMRQFHFEKTGEVYENEQQVYSEDGNKLFNPQDIDVIRSWLPEGRRNMRLKELVEWLYKWHLFTERADKLGLAVNNAEYRDLMHWALRVEHAFAYLRAEVEPMFAAPGVDPATHGLAELIVLDHAGRVGEVHPMRVQAEAEAIVRRRTMVAVDGAMHAIRGSVGINWLQEEHRDERGGDPAKLFAKADSLREAAMFEDMDPESVGETLAEAEKMFRTLATEFTFTSEGRKATTELSKMLIDRFGNSPRSERYLISQAISFYRRSQELETDMDNLCNSYFMVGFAYDEHLKNYALAEANYRWILRNTPSCALASDAEFMMLHLGEPMTSIEEIQGQSIRQGRKVEFDEDMDGDITT
jgi:hypothetical protein